MTTKNLSVALLAFLMAQNAFSSSTIDSEFELQLPRQFQQNLIEQKWKTLSTKEFQGNWKLSDQIIQTSQVPVNLKGITLDVKSHLKKPTVADSKALLQLQSQDLSADIKISEVSVDAVIEKEIGGIVGKFRIQAKCENVALKLRAGEGQMGMTLSAAVAGSQVGGQVQDVSVAWNKGGWDIADLSCSGAQGFDVILRQEIQKLADDSKAFIGPQKEMIKAQVAKYLASHDLDLSLPRQLVTSRSDISMSMTVDSYNEDATTGAMVASGHLHVEFKNSTTGASKSLSLSKTAVILNQGTEAGLKLPADFAKAVMTEAYSANSWDHQLGSDELPGFSSIMSSRFSQYFVWPELMNYSQSAKFRFDLYSDKDPQISGGGLDYDVKLNLLSRMQAPHNGGYVNFMNFALPFTSHLAMAVTPGVMKVTFTNSNLGLNYQWDPTYVANYSPSRKFGASTIRDRILKAIADKTITMHLPSLPLSEGVSLKVQSAKVLSNTDLLFRLSP